MRSVDSSFGAQGRVFRLLCLFLGPVGSALSTRWGARPVVMVGGILTSLGFIFSAFAGSLLHLYLGLGVLAGEGRGYPGLYGVMVKTGDCWGLEPNWTASPSKEQSWEYWGRHPWSSPHLTHSQVPAGPWCLPLPSGPSPGTSPAVESWLWGWPSRAAGPPHCSWRPPCSSSCILSAGGGPCSSLVPLPSISLPVAPFCDP